VSSLWTDPIVVATAVLVVAFPLLIIGAGELEERLRQRDSPLRPAVAILRTWSLPVLAVWVVARLLFGLAGDRLGVRVIATLLLLSVAPAALALTKVLVDRVRSPPDADRRRGVPRLVLAVPRLLVLLVVGWLLVDNVWGVDLTVALAAVGVGSLVISFALQSTLGGLASGLLLLADRPFRPGDWILADEVEGRVVDVSWRSSRIEDRNGDLVVVPNAQLAEGTIVNFDEPSRIHRVVVSLQIAYRNPPTLAKEMLLAAARATPGVLAEPPPEVWVVGISDPQMGYQVLLWIDDYAAAPRIKADFGALVWYQSHRHRVPLPNPAQDLYLYDGERTALAARPDRAEILRRLRRSPVLAELGDEHLDRLAAAATPARFARGEVMLGPGTTDRDLYVLDEGHARIVVDAPDGEPLEVTDVAAGELFGQLTAERRADAAPRLVAVTDCEVVRIAEAAAAAVASGYPQLAKALEHLSRTRQRRIERMLTARTPRPVPTAASDV
jgi:small-conductance mechanosensitive channel